MDHLQGSPDRAAGPGHRGYKQADNAGRAPGEAFGACIATAKTISVSNCARPLADCPFAFVPGHLPPRVRNGLGPKSESVSAVSASVRLPSCNSLSKKTVGRYNIGPSIVLNVHVGCRVRSSQLPSPLKKYRRKSPQKRPACFDSGWKSAVW